MKTIPLIGTLVFTLLIASCTNSNTDENKVASIKQQNTVDSNTAAASGMLPSFSVQDINGKVVDLQSLKGKKLFVNLWASWCPPCKREMPSIEKLYQSVDTNKVKFLLVSFDDNFDKAKKYVSSKKLKLPIYYPVQNPPALFNVDGIPATFIFNENGELIKRIEGSEDYNTPAYKSLLQ